MMSKKRLFSSDTDNGNKSDDADEGNFYFDFHYFLEAMYKLRRKTLEVQADNQNRFGLLLDRAESFLDRFEQVNIFFECR